VLGKLARQHDPNVLVGFEQADDAGVYQIAPGLALVQTVDFFTPVVDDPYIFGQIAATNALSDVYAMGGMPRTALAIVCFPPDGDLAVLERILAGGLSKMIDAGCTVIGGHSIRDDETKFGYAVTGTIDPARIFANNGARAGDVLLLTKALGTGVISTAIKHGTAEPLWVMGAVAAMTTLNKNAAEVLRRPELDVHTATDITGFGLIGHAREIALASNVSLRIEAAAVPALKGAFECIAAGRIPGGLKANREFAECHVEYANGVPEDVRTLLYDPQTAGGLLIAVAAPHADALLAALAESKVRAARVGEVLPPGKPLVRVE
jgi:selenide,water dikinase